MDRIQPEWMEHEWIVVADSDPVRTAFLTKTLDEIGFPRERIVHADCSTDALARLKESSAAILFLDDSLGIGAFRESFAHLKRAFGARGFFLFAITEGNQGEFVDYAAEAGIDGIIFRPFALEEFKRRVGEVFAAKWSKRVVQSAATEGDLRFEGEANAELFAQGAAQEARLGRRDTLVPDPKLVPLLGLRAVTHPAVTPGKDSFEKVRLAFRAVARNGETLAKAFPIHAFEVSEDRAIFECAADVWEAGDHVTIETDITHGPEKYLLRIEGKVLGEAGVGLITVAFDSGNRTRFEAAMKMVVKRFAELKDFFKYAKGA